MIVPMKKLFVLLPESKKTEVLKALRNLGVVHMDYLAGEGDYLEELTGLRDIVQRSISYFSGKKKIEPQGGSSAENVIEIAKRILNRQEKSKAIAEEISSLKKELERLDVWGDFNPEDLKMLDMKGIHIKLFGLTKEQKKSLPDSVTLFPVKSLKKITYAALIIPEGIQLPELQEVVLPLKGMSAVQKQLDEKIKEREAVDAELNKLSGSLPQLKSLLIDLDSKLEFETLRSGMKTEDKVGYVSGFIPENEIDRVKAEARKYGWGILIRDPLEEENVPTLVKNPAAVRIIQPVFEILNIIPGYKERDISLFFLLFLSIFFAMIVGDAGYGLVFLTASLYVGFRSKKKSGKIPQLVFFMIVMSVFTIIWGAVTGTWFGSVTIAQVPFFKGMIIKRISTFGKVDTSELIKHICFILGTIQISIAHIWNFIEDIKKKPVIRAFAQLGWLSMVNGLYFLILNFVLSSVKYPVPQFAMYMIIGGFAAVLLFSEQEGNVIKGVLKGFSSLMTIFLSSIGAFSDIISYIRLFAVGLATVAVASSFNAMAASMGHGVIGIIGSVIILLLGHGLNLAMGSLAIIVHGVRLNLLEFSGHLQMEWIGIQYNPFRNRTKEK